MYAHYWDPRFIPYFNGLANKKQMLCFDWLALDGVMVPARAKSRIFSVYREDILCSPGQSWPGIGTSRATMWTLFSKPNRWIQVERLPHPS